MRVCLANPSWRIDGKKGIRAGCRVPNTIGDRQHTFTPFPFTLAYAMSLVEQQEGVEAMIIDAIAEDLDRSQYLRRVKDFRPDLVISEMATESHSMDIEVALTVKEETGASIAVCGPHASALAKEILTNEDVDFVLIGEYERTAIELIAALRDNKPYDEMEGLGYRNEQGKAILGKRRSLIPELDDLPLPHRATLPMDSYRVAGFPGPVLFMYASRGCPYRCTFCVWPQWFESGTYRTRSPESVVIEIQEAQRLYGPFGSIYFDDDTFNLGPQRMSEMARLFKERGMSLPWGCNARPDRFTPEMMAELADAGMFNIRIGVESGDPEVLRRTKKDLDLSTIQPCIDMAHDCGVKVHVTFTIGLSGESWDSVKRTAKFAKSITPDSIAFTVTTPFPGTEYYEEVVRDGFLETKDWNQFNVVSSSVICTEKMSREEILEAEKYVMRQVYYSPQYLMRRLRYARSPQEILALARKGAHLLFRRF